METIHLNRDNLQRWQQRAEPNVMALGCFDGLHLGHCEVIHTASMKAQEMNVSLSVMSFFPHPKSVLSDGKIRVEALMPLSEKEKRLRSLGVDRFYIVAFDKAFAALPPEQFVGQYLLSLGVVHAVAGFDFSYGAKGAGHTDRLASDAGGLIGATKVEKVDYRGEKISSTCIRERLLQGRVEELPHFLGQCYKSLGEWNGSGFRHDGDCMLPAPGRYAVTITDECSRLQTEVIVKNNQVQYAGAPLALSKGTVTMEWNRCLHDEPRGILTEDTKQFRWKQAISHM